MKKLIAKGPMHCELEEVPMPAISNGNQILVGLTHTGVCMSEHYDWKTAKEGMSFGHEPLGIVKEIGSRVTKCKVGDRVSGFFDGSSEFAVAEEGNIYVMPDSLDDTEAVIEPLACMVSAVSKVRLPVIGDKAAVVGCGYMGCGAISLLALRGAYVVAIDKRPECLEAAKKYGAREIYTPEEFFRAYTTGIDATGIGTWSGDAGFPLVMEWGENNESLDLAINITRMCGQLAIGAYHTGEKRLVDVQQLNVKAIDCLSTHPREWDLLVSSGAAAVRMLSDGTWGYRNIPTKVYPISMFDRAHAELSEKYGKWMKAVVDWKHGDFEPYIVHC